jgi:DNA invertase Pin-like site-specific DNA recombinase
MGYELIEEKFADEGYSGATLDRPAFQRLLSVIRSGGIERLVIYRLDRLSRNLRHFTTLFEELKDHDVELYVVTAPETGAVALDRFMLNILASFSEFERDLAASRIAESRAHLKAHGRRIAGATPFGYSADPHTKQLVVCEEEAEAVVRMFKWADAGVTPSVTASCANALRWITGGGNPWCDLPVGSPRHPALRQMQPADEHAYRALRTGNPVLLSMPVDGRRARGLQGRDDLRP